MSTLTWGPTPDMRTLVTRSVVERSSILKNPLYPLPESRDLELGIETPQLGLRGRVYWPAVICGHTGNPHLLGATQPIAASLGKL